VLTTPLVDEPNARAFVEKLIPKASLLHTLAGTQHFEVPRAAVKLSKAFTEIEAHRQKLNILDWGMSSTTLEEVFLHITERVGEGDDIEGALVALSEEAKRTLAATAVEDGEIADDEAKKEVRRKKKSGQSKGKETKHSSSKSGKTNGHARKEKL